ncbi:sulfite oxidase-like oxidoreductase [Sphingomonas arantia]|uniref:Sulfite oxidase-like oxidoreductase n=1 Tax=Sphingomonas arantia TaxID=1460676 RepID=A0ABW4U0B5_9SPHN
MTETPPPSKLTATKRDWAAEGRFLKDAPADPATRLPPGQHLVKNWPVLDLGQQPDIAPERWRLQIGGLVDRPGVWDWDVFQRQPRSRIVSDIHCVTTWSRYDNRWDGVATRDLVAFAEPRPEARFVAFESYDGYTTNLPIADFASEHALLADRWEGEPLTRDHGGPVRLVVPHLYFWKSPKWLKRIDFLADDRPGFWEVNGYHARGDPWTQQRYTSD